VWGKPFGVGNTVTGYVMCQHIDGLDLALDVWVAIKQGTRPCHVYFARRKNRDMWYIFNGQNVCKVLKFT
jgi:hypothetical protein